MQAERDAFAFAFAFTLSEDDLGWRWRVVDRDGQAVASGVAADKASARAAIDRVYRLEGPNQTATTSL